MSNEALNHHTILGWDVGGAHLKVALTDMHGGVLQVLQVACPLWRGMDALKNAVNEVLGVLSVVSHQHAVTMTGELADIFPDRMTGVMEIADLMCQMLPGRVTFYAGKQGLVAIADVAYAAKAIASANWMASGSFLTSRLDEALLIDIGSTTSDFIVVAGGEVRTYGQTDAERMQRQELVYSGVVRTPLMAIARSIPFQGFLHNTASEYFATTADVYRLTGDLASSDDMADTADGTGKSPEETARRLARMVGSDLMDASFADWLQLAQAYKQTQLDTLAQAALCALSRGALSVHAPIVGAGAGSFLAEAIAYRLDRPYMDIADFIQANQELRRWAKICLPAYAVAVQYATQSHTAM